MEIKQPFSKSCISVTFAAMVENLTIKTALHYGSMSGIAVFLFYMSLYFSGFNVFGPVNLLGVWIPVVFLVLALKFHRNHNLGGFITFGQGFYMGFLTTIFGATLFGLAFYLFGTIYDDGLVDTYKTEAARSLEAGKTLLSDKFIDNALDSIDEVTMPSLAFSESFSKVMGGSIVSLVLALIFKHKQQPEIPE